MKKLSNFGIAYRNLTGKPGGTITLIAVVAALAFTLFGGMILSKSLDNGMNSLQSRLGADIAIVPIGSANDYEDTILSGAPAGFYFDNAKAEQVSGTEGVSQVTTQFYLASLVDSGCCTGEVQIAGIDFATDFVVKPWISNIYSSTLGDNEVIVGCDVTVDGNNTVTYFNTVLNVAAKLGRTATGMDGTAYMSIKTAREIAKTAKADGKGFEDVDIDNSISVVLAGAAGSDITGVADNVMRTVAGVSVIESNGIYSNIATSLGFFTGMVTVITVMLGIFAVLLLAVLFAMIMGGRKKEFAILRVMGATRKKLAGIVLTESCFVSFCGAVIGILLASIIVFPFARQIGLQLGMPLLLPAFGVTLGLLAVGLIIAAAVGPLAAGYSAWRISRAETYATLREGE